MGKWIAILLGLILIALGVWGIIEWREDVWKFVKAGLVVAAIIVGMGAFAFGWSEIRSAAEERKLAEPVAPTPPPSEATPPPSAAPGGESSGEGAHTRPPGGG